MEYNTEDLKRMLTKLYRYHRINIWSLAKMFGFMPDRIQRFVGAKPKEYVYKGDN